VESVNNRIEAIKGLVEQLKVMADELRRNATAIKELDVSGMMPVSELLSSVHIRQTPAVLNGLFSSRGGFTHVRPNRGPHKKGPPQEDRQIFATQQHAGNN